MKMRPTAVIIAFLVLLLAACDTLPLPLGSSSESDEQAEEIAPVAARLSPEEVVEQFMAAWNAQDTETMYSFVSPRSQEIYPYQVFENRYTVANNAMQFAGMTYTISNTREQGLSTAVNYDVVLESSLFGTIEDPNRTMRLVQGDGGWRIAWTPMDIIDGLAAGVNIQVDTRFPQRANIYDRNGNILVEDNGTVVAIYGVQQDMNVERCIDLLATMLRRNRLELVQLFGGYLPETFFHIAEVDRDTYLSNRDNLQSICGIYDTGDANTRVRELVTRRYWGSNVATHITGYVGFVPEDELQLWQSRGYQAGDIVGRAGIERTFEEELAGQPERILRMIEPGGATIRELGGATGSDPAPVTLTINRELQAVVSQTIYDAYNYAANNWGSLATGTAAVVMNVNTGEILALASYPTFEGGLFNPNTSYPNALQQIVALNTNPRSPLSNKAVQEQYTPGSVFKIVTAVAAANERLFAPDDLFTCGLEWRGQRFGDQVTVRLDWRATDEMEAAGDITMAQSLTASCNPFFWEVGGTLFNRDQDLLIRYASELGFGSRTGLNVLGPEAAGNLADPDSATQAINNAIGQGDVQVTALQLATMVSAIANRGTLYRPFIVQQIGGVDGAESSFVGEPTVVRELPYDALVYDVVFDGMCAVTTDDLLGTAYWVFSDAPYTSCGKTGTAQAGPPQSNIPPHAWYTTFAPADDPQIAIAIVTTNSREGSEVSAPMVRRILDYYFNAPQAPFPEWWEDDYVPLNVPNGGSMG